MEAASSSEMPVTTYPLAQIHIQEDMNPQISKIAL
jgi:hypothetical protein